ncbi:uncharacterized protein F5Z01DRAFT_645343 [Emericellopsis atlantica]|uniref:Uncharacterized protein n=1 Tax=Emericellopsis atlantica TaxID=2614577 RepID=A0A9P7ZTW3_9HYPO|nr:uncharacterized protein F5Z01DRAFT_645343 [Emericellopsis atlantica]KAG9258175.1 hypothetical protein F5Z01DRAFT_645343 [Emericellopsis atlantica]
MAITERSVPMALLFNHANVVLIIYTVCPFLFLDLSGVNVSFFIAILLGLGLIVFLVYRTLACLRICASKTDKLDILFYQDRKGSFAMMVMGSIWAFVALMVFSTSVIDILLKGEIYIHFGNWANVGGIITQFIFGVLIMGSPFTLAGLFGWAVTTAVQGLWRISAPSEGREALMRGHDEWDEWKDNQG